MARFTNQAQLRYGNAVTNSNVAVGEILEVLSATKTAVKTTYGQNDTVTYIISIVNSGATAFNGLTLTDDLGAYTFGTGTVTPLTYIPGTINYYINGTLQTAPTVEAGPPLTVSGISVPANGNATIIYETAVNEFAPFATGSDVVNTARITGTAAGGRRLTVNVVTKSGKKRIGQGNVTTRGRYRVTIPKQKKGTVLLLLLTDKYGNRSYTELNVL